MIAWILSGLIVALVVLYLVSPPIQRISISAARFFDQLPEQPRPRRLRLSLRRLITTPLFWLQLLALLLLLAAVLTWQRTLAADLGPRRIGLLLAVDTSASMSTLQAGEPRLAAAQAQAATAFANSIAAARGGSWCARVVGFDLDWRELGAFSSPEPALAALGALTPRPLGTDLELARQALATTPDDEGQGCVTTHAVVISDRPEPAWRAELPTPLTWVDVGQIVSNVGFTALSPVRNELSGAVEAIRVEVGAFGPPPALSRVSISGPAGAVRVEELPWGDVVVREFSFVPDTPGTYTLSLTPDGAYAYDDTAVIVVEAPQPVLVDWRLDDRALLDELGWQQTERAPQVRIVTPAEAPAADTTMPTLVVGPGYLPDGQQRPVGDFDEASPLLSDLNLDVAEQAGIPPAELLPPEFAPVLTGADGAVWIASRSEPPGVYVPGLPTFGDDNVSSLSQTVFFNALRTLLGRRAFPELYTLTTAAAPEPEGNRLALHPGEGDTGVEPRSGGSLDDWSAGPASRDPDQLCPPLLAAALAIVALERAAALLGGRRWS